MDSPILAKPDLSETFLIYTDASKIALGAILAQIQDGKEVVIEYASRTLNKGEANYCPTELEALALIWAIRKFRHYVYGQKFKVITDHNALKWLMSGKLNNPKLERWALKLQGYNFEIEHRPGKNHNNVDPLSRLENHQIHVIFSRDQLEDVAKMQQADTELQDIIHRLEEARDRWEIEVGNGSYEIQNGVLYKSPTTEEIQRKGYRGLKLVIPYRLRQKIIQEHHDSIFAGHLGLKKTYAKISEKYYWENMYKDIKEWINSCMDCVMKKSKVPKNLGETGFVQAKEPLEIVGMDFIGPLPRSKNGNKYILVFMDLFTRWPEAIAVKKATGKIVAKNFVENFVCRYGTPKNILSDRGKAFIQGIMAEIKQDLGLYHKKTSPYHAKTNGAVERFNRTLQNMIAMYVNAYQDDWDTILPYVLFAYRTSFNEATQETPYYLMFIRDPNLPSDLLEAQRKMRNLSLGLNNKTEEAAIVHQKVLDFDLQSKAQRDILSKTKENPYHVGDLVLLYQPSQTPGLSKKLLYPWRE